MRAMFLIASKGRPEFKSWNTISARFSFQLNIILFLQIFFNIVHLNILAFRFRTFLGRALTFDPDQRATAEELLNDPFITRLDNTLQQGCNFLILTYHFYFDFKGTPSVSF